MKFEEAGVQEASQAVFVLVAGGLGERLGYSGIKVILRPFISLPAAVGSLIRHLNTKTWDEVEKLLISKTSQILSLSFEHNGGRVSVLSNCCQTTFMKGVPWWNMSQIALPSQTTTGISFLEVYIQSILALQAASSNFPSPWYVDMVSNQLVSHDIVLLPAKRSHQQCGSISNNSVAVYKIPFLFFPFRCYSRSVGLPLKEH